MKAAEIARGPLTLEAIANLDRIADSAGADTDALASEPGEAAIWLRALLLEKLGRFEEAWH